MKKLIYSTIVDFCAWWHRNRKIKPNGKINKANLGSGFLVTKDWINVDGNINVLFRNFPIFILKIIYRITGTKKWMTQDEYLKTLKSNIFVHHKFQYGMPFIDNSLDYIYTSNFIEHLFKTEAEYLFKEIYRCLKPGGVLRITVPDFQIGVDLFQKGEKQQAIEKFFFVTDSYTDFFSIHKYLYDFEMLRDTLTQFGYKNINKCEYKQGKTPDIDYLDTKPNESLFVEAEK